MDPVERWLILMAAVGLIGFLVTVAWMLASGIPANPGPPPHQDSCQRAEEVLSDTPLTTARWLRSKNFSGGSVRGAQPTLTHRARQRSSP
jgi:hypothetical protein